MSIPVFWAALVLAVIIVIFLTVVILLPIDHAEGHSAADVSINAAGGSIVTVRKVGAMTRVTIRNDIHDHWEGSDGIDISPTPIEVTKQEEPELYAEYMSPSTSALRKYEIAGKSYPY